MRLTLATEDKMTKLFDTLKVGQVVTFVKVPCGSYTRPNEQYIVESKSKSEAYFRSVARGSGTHDSAWAINMAEVQS
jgi:hypothetical protein